KDDVLACLIHMGYLGYDASTKEAFIPNSEVAEVFEAAVKTGDWDDVGDALCHADELLRAVWNGEEEKVAKGIAASHQDYASIIEYNDENALACAIMMSFYTSRADYRVVRELPAGKGFADVAFIPRREGERPAMIIELKWNRSAKAAIKQIKDKNYAGALSGYHGDILLVGINYTKKTKKYTCKIEKVP
ncbi:MAG: PD-(D/E)XK nuclease domain-containing protein, partial [Lachnospiraceae bacterium]|nr:PD-(D/E)XK nuclease domain-containing protein [Lachnospiraceae bacterium]